MANSNDPADEIRRRMAEIRSEMHHEMSEVVTGALSASDWRSYPKSRPWLSLGIAFASGYLLVPRRSKPIAEVLVKEVLAKEAKPLASAPKKTAGQPLFMKLLMGSLSFGGPLLMRAVQGYALREMESFLEAQTKTGPSRQNPPQGPTPNTTRARSDSQPRF